MMRCVAGFVLLAAVGWGQNDERRKQNPELFQLAERAQTVSAEFASSTLLRVAASPKMTDGVWKKDLINEAFRFVVERKVFGRNRQHSDYRLDDAGT